ncbi:MAG: DNA mismatch repair protein MutS [Deltaproteobacteria bacterium]|uniref:DNA mismatch repair protein MutS n=1 Tax=Candidatus Zymogenus saltonus TaxID=2844893 RepID=A0A9D8PJC0_9DELT|nr:DNA mismatch repair protein MutS [Candidatus Zymogenus saltonus]
MQDLTPMLRQYHKIKEDYPDCILFYRMGDFYEMFFEDAMEASPVLEIALTTRDKGKENPVPMCGVPYHAAENYISRLLKNGYKVAICEQVEDPAKAKGIVRREVVRVVTPGLSGEIGGIESKENNYIAGLVKGGDRWGASFLDFSTGEFRTTELDDVFELIDEISKLNPREVVMPEGMEGEADAEPLYTVFSHLLITYMDPSPFSTESAAKTICEIFNLGSVDGLGIKETPLALSATGGLLRYVVDYQRGEAFHLSFPRLYVPSEFMLVDDVTKRNLELVKTLYEGARSGSLLSLLDRTVTSMGGRLLRGWINYPLTDVTEIQSRLDAVESFYNDRGGTLEITEMLSQISDIERIVGRVSTNIAGPRDLAALSGSLKMIPVVRESLERFKADAIDKITEGFAEFAELVEKIDKTLVESPPPSLRDGGIIADGVNEELDELRSISREGKDWILRIEEKERVRTKIPKLKIRYNKVFGYYIEVSNIHTDKVPNDYIRKQTLVSAERYITPELKEYEAKVLGADDRIKAIEYDIFVELRDWVKGWIRDIKAAAASIAALDVYTSLALCAIDLDFTKPVVDESLIIEIRDGRHPMVEKALPKGTFVANDISVDTSKKQLLIITGPNMAGKSTIIRQVAVIVLMAQIGSFVSASHARIGVVDRIFTRVGASDSIVRGQSTFMVEMVETANILNNATGRSLVILDEIGRGTSTFDGLSIAWAVAEYIHDNATLRPRTLFATHYHELTELSAVKERVKNYYISAKEWNGRMIFSRTIKEGVSSRSYGINVARLAGIPHEVIERAKAILENIERGEFTTRGIPALIAGDKAPERHTDSQLDLFYGDEREFFEEVAALDTQDMTPLDALNRLDEIVKKLKKIKEQ